MPADHDGDDGPGEAADDRFTGTNLATVLASGTAWGRVNLLGEHTDYNDGFVLPTLVPYCTIVDLSPSPDRSFHARSLNLSQSVVFGAEDEQVPSFARYLQGCVRALRDVQIEVPPLTIRIRSTVPIGVGLSSSAALEVAFLRALRTLLELRIDDLELARIAHRAEFRYAGVHCGVMDQMASSLGQRDSMLFVDTRSLRFRRLPLPPQCSVLVIDSNSPRNLASTPYNQRRDECAKAASLLGLAALRDLTDLSLAENLPPPLLQRVRHVYTENARVLEARTADAQRFGQLMNASHASLRDDFEVSSPALDALVVALQAQQGVLGARLTGAGFGGACVALVRTPLLAEAREGALAAFAAAGYTGTALA